ncbi:MAG: AmmeMemoRadiSam system protein B, partial [Candidatus Uhrbacteria bacterium]
LLTRGAAEITRLGTAMGACAETFAGLSGMGVVVLSPNHFSTGHNPAQISQGNWFTPYGILETDHQAVDRLLAESSILKNEEQTFENEHGVSALTPFIKRSFPKAKIVPIVLHESLSYEQARELGQVIAEQLPNSFVIASLDMSHYLPEYVSIFHDAVSEAIIARGGCDSCELEVDSNVVLHTLWEINSARETEQWHKLYRGSAVTMGVVDDYQDNTSHLIGYFKNGDPLSDPVTSFTFLGDIMLGRYIGDLITAQGPEYPWEQMSRFLSGTDYVVGNFEGTVCDQVDQDPEEPPYDFSFSFKAVLSLAEYLDIVSLANNHSDDFAGQCFEQTEQALNELGLDHFGKYNSSEQTHSIDKVTFIGYNQFGTDQMEVIAEIEKASAQGQMTIVFPHWGIEYQFSSNSSQQELAEEMTQAGADLIIGTHPHVVQETTTIDSTTVFYSLGNFIFDQDLPGTNQGLAVGAIVFSDRIELYSMPYELIGWQPQPINDNRVIINEKLTNYIYE